jgi:hypothetical protein
MLTLRPLKLGPPAYAHLADYEIIIGRIMEQREPMPDREWFWALKITGAYGAAWQRPATPPTWRRPRQPSAHPTRLQGLDSASQFLTGICVYWSGAGSDPRATDTMEQYLAVFSAVALTVGIVAVLFWFNW